MLCWVVRVWCPVVVSPVVGWAVAVPVPVLVSVGLLSARVQAVAPVSVVLVLVLLRVPARVWLVSGAPVRWVRGPVPVVPVPLARLVVRVRAGCP